MPRSAWAALRRAAELRGSRGGRALVPVLGSGFNAQAAPSLSMGWLDLLRDVARASEKGGAQSRLTDDVLSGGVGMTLVWETLIADLSAAEGISASRIEQRLQRRVARGLRDVYRPDGPTAAFARRFLDLGFDDILSFNFDEVLLVDDQTLSPTNGNDPLRLHHAATGQRTRIWYPHGSVRRPLSIRLGMRLYGTYIEALRRAFSQYKATERRQRQARASARRRTTAQTWVDAAIDAPLVFIGLSLHRDEWPMWWFLNQRARNHARRATKDIPPTFIFMSERGRQALEPAARLVGAQFISYGSSDRDRAWSRLFRSLGAALR